MRARSPGHSLRTVVLRGTTVLLWAVFASTSAPVASAPPTTPQVVGRPLFLKTCAPCHSPDGSASTPAARKLGVKDLRASRISDADIARQIRDGVQAVPEKASQKMPAFRETLSAEQIESLVPVVKALRKTK